MKNFKYIISILFISLLLGCEKDDSDTGFADAANAPQNLTALFTITQDNTGLVTIAPHGEGAVSYYVYFGDGTALPATVGVAEKVQHTYPEGQYDVKLVATGINGKTTEAIIPLTVSFIAPENLEVNIGSVPGNSLAITVSATADFETYFEATFGDDTSATPVQFNEGQTINHTYAAIGTYTVTVTAYSGGAATAVETVEVVISNPLELPITFENSSLNYEFTTFNGATAAVLANPDMSGINTSATVASMTPAGSEWTGGLLTLNSPVDFSQGSTFKMKIWSPEAGIPVLLKLENLTDATIFSEQTATTTVANEWEELVFNFSAAAASGNDFSKIVLFFNAAQPGNGDTYYFDDIENYDGTDPVALPLTFESPTAQYIFNNFGGATGFKTANPDQSGINTSANVAQVDKAAGSETWAGVAIPMAQPIDFSTMQKVKVKVWSSQPNITVLLKFENMNPHNTALDIERSVTTTVTNGWEEVTFDFTGINNANNYQQAVIFFDFDVAGTGATYYFDDIQLSN